MEWSFVGNLVIHAAGETWNAEARRMEGTHRALGDLYAAALGTKVVRNDWSKVARTLMTFPQIAIDGIESDDYVAPQWPDAKRPAQIHPHIEITDRALAAAAVEQHGGRVVTSTEERTVCVDSEGPPFCLVDPTPDVERLELSWAPPIGVHLPRPARVPRAQGRISRIVLDCLDPSALVAFYGGLLDMEEVAPGVVARSDRAGAELGFEAVAGYQPPVWGDDARHQQAHLDIWFSDRDEARARAEALGAVRLPYDGAHPVYADPAGHPFCLLKAGQ